MVTFSDLIEVASRSRRPLGLRSTFTLVPRALGVPPVWIVWLSVLVGLTTLGTLVSETGLLPGWLSGPISCGSSCPSCGQGSVPVHLAAKPGRLRAGSQPDAKQI